MGLEVENLRCVRGGRLVLDGLGFSLAAGRALMLRGPNGAGKTTLLRVLAGLVPFEGTMRLEGISPQDRDGWDERVAYAGHLDAVKPQLSVAENLEFWAGLFGGAPPAAMAAMNLTALADRPAGMCSAGQKRRLGLARLLLARRDLWLLDEPTVSLDTASAAALIGAVTAHLDSGGMAVIATHTDLGLRADELQIEPYRGTQATDPFGGFSMTGAFG